MKSGSFVRLHGRILGLAVALLAAVSVPGLPACGGDDSAGGSGGNGGLAGGAGGSGVGGQSGSVSTQPQEPNYRPCPRDNKVGAFSVALKVADGSGFTVFQGSVFDSANPLDALSEESSAGSCRLLNRKVVQCTPSCSSVEKPICGRKGCVAFPVQKNVGTLNVAGLNGGIEVTPSAKNFYSNDGVLTYPGVEEGKDVILTAAGGDYPGFTLMAKGIAPLEFTTDVPLVKKGQGLTLAWKAPTVATGARLYIVLSLDNHGTTPQQIECDAPDTGSFEIPASLLESLTTLGVSGFPSISVSRRSVESKVIAPGCVEFNVTSSTVLSVAVDGVKSCKKNEDCSAGQTCQVNLTCK